MKSTTSRPFDILLMRLRSLFRRRQVEDELDEELRFHFESVVDGYMASGMSEAEARRRARLVHRGSEQVKEECRDMRRMNFLDNLVRDTAYAWRSFRQNPGFAITAMATIALGVGVNTALFALVYSVVFRPLPVSDPDTIRNVYVGTRGKGMRHSYGTPYFVSFVEYQHMREHSKTADLSGIAENSLSWQGHPEAELKVQLVSDNLLPLIGAKPVLGRLIAPEEASVPGSTPVVVLSYTAWQKHFGRAMDVVGKTMILNRTQFTIVGVADEKATGPLMTKPDVWIPITMQALTRPGEPLIATADAAWIQLLARRRPGYSDDQLRSEMEVVAQQAIAAHDSQRQAMITVAPGAFLNYPMIMQQGLPVAAILFLAVCLVLLVACANVANMLLARGLARRREIAIRLSIGAGNRRVLQQLLTESVWLGVAGGAVGLLLSQMAAQAVLASVPASEIGAHQIDLSPDARVLLYTLAVAILTGLAFGLMPALNILRMDLTPALKSEGLESTGKSRRFWLQNTLIGVQVAVSLVLLINAGLLLRGFNRALSMDIGRSSRNVLIGSFDFRQQQYSPEKAEALLQGVRDRALTMPGVKNAATTSLNPLSSHCGTSAQVVDKNGQPGAAFFASCEEVGEGYFDTMRIAVRQGRPFLKGDNRPGNAVAIVDESFARRYFPGQPAVGHHIRSGDSRDLEVIGVVADVKELEIGTRTGPKVYTPLRGQRHVESKLLVSYDGPAEALFKPLKQAAESIDPQINATVDRIEDNVHMALLPVQVAAAAASAMGGLALVLACTGVYGVVSFAVNRRRREVGIRMALGAGRFDVLRLIAAQAMKPVFIGTVVGVVLGGAASQLIRAMLFGLSPFDPLSFVSTVGLLIAVAVAAILIPARSAVTLEPSITLRHD